MAVKSPQHDLPRGIGGASDQWDTKQAGVILTDDFFLSVGTTYTRVLTETLAVLDSSERLPARSLSETVTATDSVSRSASRSLQEVIPVIDMLRQLSSSAFFETVSVVDSFARNTGRLLNETLTIVDSFVRQAGKLIRETLTILDTRSISPPAFKQATVNSSLVPSTQTNFPSYVDLSRIGITTLAQAQSVRVYSDSGKLNELAREIVSITEMHVKVSSLTSTATIYVDYDGIRADYAVTATYGRNAVWSDYIGVWHLQSNSNSSTGSFDGTDTAISYLAGKIGSSADFNGSTSQIALPVGSAPTGDVARTISLWFRSDITTGSENLFGYGIISPRRTFNLMTNNNGIVGALGVNCNNADFATASGVHVNDSSTQQHVAVTYLGGGLTNTNLKLYYNGVDTTINNPAAGVANTSNSNFGIGYGSVYAVGSNDGRIDEVRTRNTALSANWITTEYNNQNDEAAFWGTWTTVSTGSNYSQILTELVTILDVFTRQPSRIIREMIVVLDIIARLISRSLNEAVTVVDFVFRTAGRALSEVVTVIDSVRARIATKIINEIVTVLDSINRSVSRALSEVVTVIDRVIRNTGRLLSELVTIVDTNTLTKVTAKAYTEVIMVVDTLVAKVTARVLTEVIVIVDRLTRTSSRAFSETLTILDTVGAVLLGVITITRNEVITVVDTVRRSTGRLLVEAVRVTDSFAKSLGRLVSEAITVVDTYSRSFLRARTFSEIITVVDSIRVRFSTKIFVETITIVDNFFRTMSRSLLESVLVTDLIGFFKKGRGYILGLNKNTNTGVGKSNPPQLGRNKNTNTGIGKKLD